MIAEFAKSQSISVVDATNAFGDTKVLSDFVSRNKQNPDYGSLFADYSAGYRIVLRMGAIDLSGWKACVSGTC
jgi:uncharacterized protein YfdQ (DUF2303 family)